MTLEQSINDKNRPLSVSPFEWMQYKEANEKEDEDLLDGEAKRIIAEQNNINPDEVNVSPEQKLDIGIEQMILGCRMVNRTLLELNRKDVSIKQRNAYKTIKDLMDNAISPYLADILKERNNLIRDAGNK